MVERDKSNSGLLRTPHLKLFHKEECLVKILQRNGKEKNIGLCEYHLQDLTPFRDFIFLVHNVSNFFFHFSVQAIQTCGELFLFLTFFAKVVRNLSNNSYPQNRNFLLDKKEKNDKKKKEKKKVNQSSLGRTNYYLT